MRRSLFIALALAVGVAACGDSGTGPATANIGGTWEFSSSMTDTQHSISCNAVGNVVMSQSGSTFTGSGNQQGSCTGPGGAFDNSGSITITGGQINGSSVSFQSPFCQYQGTIESSNRMNGTTSCSFQDAGTTFTFSGTWQASR